MIEQRRMQRNNVMADPDLYDPQIKSMVTNYWIRVNSLPNYKVLDSSKLKAFAKDNVIEKLKFVLGRVKNFVGKGENVGYQYFLLFPQCFQMSSYTGSLKFVIVW